MERYGEDDPFDLYDFLAAMTELPAPVLRGMMADDGAEVLIAGRPFLPPFVEAVLFRTAPNATTVAPSSEAGGATRSAPLAP